MVRVKKEYNYNGVTYSSYRELGEAVGVNRRTLVSRVRNGDTLVEAIEKGAPTEYSYGGVTYSSYRELGEAVGVNGQTLVSRVRNGDTLEEAIEKGAPTEYNYRGVAYSSYRELGEAVGIDGSVLVSRVGSGYTLEEAIEKGTPKEYSYQGVTYSSYQELGGAVGIDGGVLASRVGSGYTLVEAIEKGTPTEYNRSSFTYRGVDYKSLIELCAVHGVCSSVVASRLNSGCGLIDAVTRPVRGVKRKNMYIYKGNNYNTVRELVQSVGLNINIVRRVADKHEISSVEAVGLLDDFLTRYHGNKPAVMTKIPRVIYNGEWYGTMQELYNRVGVTHHEVATHTKCTSLVRRLDIIREMSTLTRERRREVSTGAYLTTGQLRLKYKIGVDKLDREGITELVEYRVYPNCTYEETGYCAEPLADYKVYEAEYFNNN